MNLISEFHRKMAEHQLDFDIAGLLARDGRIYPFGTDTKVLSTIFEMTVRPFILEIAQGHNLCIYEPPQQNFYPDFTLMSGEEDTSKIAIDVKSTYRNFRTDHSWTAAFTLGSYTSFLRNETKNIAFPYSQYEKHYIIGFIYSRTTLDKEAKTYTLEDVKEVPCPFYDVEFFVQEKHRISGEHPGSGNTTNIGSIRGSSIKEFSEGNGPFAELDEEVFVDYWRNYGKSSGERAYSNLSEYLQWKEK